MPTPRLVRKVVAALSRLLPGTNQTRLGVAVSGGPDSVALLGALVFLKEESRLTLTVLHVNHGLRPEAEAEQQLVETLCARWQLPCIIETLTPPAQPSGIETWARGARYRFFQRAQEEGALDAIALAHTLDDQAETVLFRFLRGSARRGLAGIPPLRALHKGWIIRPLLDCSRQEVLAYLESQNLSYALDASNTDLRFSRNRIRHRLLPLLEQEFSPRLRHHLAALATTFREEEIWLEMLATTARARIQTSPTTLSLSKLATEPAPLQARILRQWLEEGSLGVEVSFVHLQAVRDLSTGRLRGSVDTPGNRRVRREGDSLVIEERGIKTHAKPYRYPLVSGEDFLVADGAYRIVLAPLQEWKGSLDQVHSADLWQALFDGEAVRCGILVRTGFPGDRLQPLGMCGHKKVQDVFVDAKVPSSRRPTWPVVVIGSEVAWIPGCVRSETAKITAMTRWVCRMMVIPLPEK